MKEGIVRVDSAAVSAMIKAIVFEMESAPSDVCLKVRRLIVPLCGAQEGFVDAQFVSDDLIYILPGPRLLLARAILNGASPVVLRHLTERLTSVSVPDFLMETLA